MSKKTLFLFDCDKSIVNGDIFWSVLVPSFLSEEEEAELEGKETFFQKVDDFYHILKQKGAKIEQIKELAAKNQLNCGMKELFDYLRENKDKFYVVLLTSDDYVLATNYLKSKNLYDVFDGFVTIKADI